MLPLTRSRNRARFFGTPFSPEALFAGGTVAGAWYDPSDLTTLFTTSAGTTQCAMPGGGSAVVVGRMLDKSGNGNHAIAFNDTTARPELRARVNLLTYSEDFSQGVWTKGGVTVNTGGSVQQLVETATNGLHRTYIDVATTPGANVESKLTALLGYGGRQYAYVQLNSRDAGADVDYCYAILDLTTGLVTDYGAKGTAVFGSAPTVVAVANNLWQISYTGKVNASSAGRYVNISLCDKPLWSQLTLSSSSPSYSGNIANSMYVGGIDLRPANIGANVPAYQRIADANTYDTSGFPLYLRFDGIDDSMYTPAGIGILGNAEFVYWLGINRQTTAASNAVFGWGSSSGAGQACGQYRVSSVESVQYAGGSPFNFASGPDFRPNVFSYSKTPGAINTTSSARLNGLPNNGTGNSSTVPNIANSSLKIGQWADFPSDFFNGHLYSLIIAGSAVSAGNISATEQWVAQKTGLVIP